jgi:RNA polymerase sigma-70 factor (ECF subfamily)
MSCAATLTAQGMGFRPRSSSSRRVADPSPGNGQELEIGLDLRDGEEGAIERLYERYSRTVFSYLVSRLGDRAAAEDVQQQVFAEIWRRSEEFDPERSKLFTWVMVIARSRATDHLRRAVPEPHEPGRAAALVDQRAETEPTEELIERWRVAELLRRVPAEESTMLRMRFYEGLSQREIAEHTGTALGTVKMRMVQALDRMRTLIDEEGA